MLQELHGLPEILHDGVHVFFGRPAAHAQPKSVSRHLGGDTAAQEDVGGPGRHGEHGDYRVQENQWGVGRSKRPAAQIVAAVALLLQEVASQVGLPMWQGFGVSCHGF